MMIIFYRKTGERELSSIEITKNKMQNGRTFSTVEDFKWIPIEHAKRIAEMSNDEIYVVNSDPDSKIETGIYKDNFMSHITGIRSRYPNVYGSENKNIKPGEKFLKENIGSKIEETMAQLYLDKYNEIKEKAIDKTKSIDDYMPSKKELETIEKTVEESVKKRLKRVIDNLFTIEELGAVKKRTRIEKEVFPPLKDLTGDIKEGLTKARSVYLLALNFGNSETIEIAINAMRIEARATMKSKAIGMGLKSPNNFIGIVGEDDEILMDPNFFENGKNPISEVTKENEGRAIYEKDGLFIMENNKSFMQRKRKNITYNGIETRPKQKTKIESIMDQDITLVPNEMSFPIKSSI